MPFDVELPNGVVLTDIPDGTTKEQIRQKAISAGAITADEFAVSDRKKTEQERIARVTQPVEQESQSTAEDFTASMGRGFAKSIRGLENLLKLGSRPLTSAFDIPTAEEEKRAFAEVEARSHIASELGQITGEIAATAPLGLGVGAGVGRATAGLASGGRAAQTFARFAPIVSAGTVEGAIIGADEDQATTGALIGGGTAAAVEAAIPVFGKVLRRVFGRAVPVEQALRRDELGNIQPTQQLDDALNKVGLSFDDINEEVLRELPDATSPDQLARKALFESESVKPIRSRITQSVDDAQKEIQLLRQRDSEAADQLRQAVIDESQSIRSRLDELSPQFGVPANAGETVKDALDGLQSSIKAQKREAYKTLSDLAKQTDNTLNDIPVAQVDVRASIEDAQRFIPDADANKLDEIMARFGVLGDDVERKGRFTEVVLSRDENGKILDSVRFRGEPETLNIGNIENFRLEINRALNSQDGRTIAGRGQIIRSIDDEMDTILQEVGDAGFSPDVIQQAKTARALARKEKLIFNQKDLINDLTKTKPGTVTPMVEASKVVDKINAATPEQSSKLFAALRSTNEGKKAIENLKAAAIVNFIDGGFAKGGKIGTAGVETITEFNGGQFSKSLDRFGRAKLKALFRDQPEVLKTISNLEKIGQLKTADKFSVQKGSAPDLINRLLGMTSFTKRAPFIDKIGEAAEEFASKREVAKIIDFKPDVSDIEDFIVFNSPRLQRFLSKTNDLQKAATAAPSVVVSEKLTERE